MKTKILSVIAAASLAVTSFAALMITASADSVTEVSTVAELKAVANNLSGSYKLTADIDLGNDEWTPIGSSTNGKRFTGTFDGNGHTVSGLYISTTTGANASYHALFGYVGKDGTVKNLAVEGEVKGYQYVSGVVAYNNGGTVENCYNSVVVSGSSWVGGVVGYNGGTVENCYNTGTVSGPSSGSPYVGGVVGCNNAGTVTNCYNTGTVSGPSSTSAKVGDVVGYNQTKSGTVTNCYYLSGTANSGIGDDKGTSSVYALTAEQSKSQSTFVGWDFDNVWSMGDNGPELKLFKPEETTTPATATYSQVGDYPAQFEGDKPASAWSVTVTPGSDTIESLDVKVNNKSSSEGAWTNIPEITSGSVVFAVAVNLAAADVSSVTAVVNDEDVTATKID